jgi:hypothetical protein
MMCESVWSGANEFRSQSLHVQIIESARQNYGVGSRMSFQTSVKSSSVFLERKCHLWFNCYGGN